LKNSYLRLLKIEGAVGGWYVSPSGDLNYNSPGLGTVDVESDLGFEEEASPMGRLRIELPVALNIYVIATPLEFKGDAPNDFDFNSELFGTGTQTKLTFDQYDLALYYGVPVLSIASLGSLYVDVGLNVRLIDLDAEMTSGGLREQVDMTIPVPTVYLGAGFNPIDLIDLEAEIRGFSIGDNSLISVIARVNFNVVGPLYVSGGYRFEDISIDEDDLEADLEFSGPFVEVGFEL
jgi:outer membrane protein